MHVPHLDAEVVLRSEDVHTQRRLIHEVHVVGSGWDVVGCKQDAAGQFEIRRDTAMTLEVPFKRKRIKPCTVSCVKRLESEEDWNGIDSVLEASSEETGQVFIREDPSIAQACVEDRNVATSAADRVSATHPDLDFVGTLFGPRLCANGSWDQQQTNQPKSKGSFHRVGVL